MRASHFASILAPFLLATTAFAQSPAAAQTSRAELGPWGIETAYISKSVRPGDDFYAYVNEGWLKTATIPAGFPASGAFTDAFLKTEHQLKELMADINSRQQPAGTPKQQIASLYASYMDIDRRNALGLSPIQPGLDAIRAARTHDDIAALTAQPMQDGFFASGAAVDQGSPHRYALQLLQSSLGMPAAYYLADGEPYAGHRAAYRAYIEDTLRRAGYSDPAKWAQEIIALEIAIAKRHWTPADKRDAVRSYHPMTLAELEAYAPGFNWKVYFGTQGLAGRSPIVLRTDTAIQKLAALFAETPVDRLKALLTFRYVSGWSPFLSKELDTAHFEFFDKRLGGTAEQRALPDRALQFVSDDNFYGNGLGRLYVERYFPPAYRQELETMIGYMRQAFRARIQNLDWMDEPTRKQAMAKLDSIGTLLAYPDRWTDYSKVKIQSGDLAGNVLRLSEFGQAENRALLDETRRDWEFSWAPQTINAGYTPNYNRVEFPAAILQPPFFDPHADPAVNFGAIAAVIGHEMGHAFDDQGSATDADGKLRNWWTEASRTEFAKRSSVLVAQFNQYSPLPGVHVNGALTVGENIGDLCGMVIGYDAYHRYVADKLGGKTPMLDGFTGDQRFFLAWAQLWRAKASDDYMRLLVQSDTHSPGQFRVNGLMRNVDGWYTAFGVKPGDALYLPPAERVRIW